MIKTSCGPSCAFSLISWLVMVQSFIQQKKAESISYLMVLITLFISMKKTIKVQDHT